MNAKIHVDEYRYGLFRALANGVEPKAPEAASLLGFHCGNHYQEGVLTSWSGSQIHSCEEGTECEIWSKDFVRITPIITRYGGREEKELGAGGGYGDLNQQFAIDALDATTAQKVLELCLLKFADQPDLQTSTMHLLLSVVSGTASPVTLEKVNSILRHLDEDDEEHGEIRLDTFVQRLGHLAAEASSVDEAGDEYAPTELTQTGVPKQITFPYSRHSSYEELCLLIEAFKPKDIYPCTVEEKNWDASRSMHHLFGHLYDDVPAFRHDRQMVAKTSRVGATTRRKAAGSRADRPSDNGYDAVLDSMKGIESVEPWSTSNEQDRPRPTNKKRPASALRGDSAHNDHSNAEPHPPAPSRVEGSSFFAPSSPTTRNDAASITARDARVAFRREVFAAVLDPEGRAWPGIGLVSSRKVEREEEL